MIENIDNKNIQSFEYETSINSDGNIVGTCELGNATIQMLNDSNEYSSLKGQWIKTIHGSFYIHNVEPVQEKVNIKLSCYDVKYKLDIPYDSSLYSWPMTLKEWRDTIFANCDVSYDNTNFPNSDLVLEEEPYIGDNPSNRSVISIIAQAGCSWVDTDKDDIFYFKWFDNTIHIVNDWIELTTEKEMSSPINVVVLGRGDVEDNVKWPEILPENPVEFRIDNNYILDPQDSTEDKRYDVIERIYNRVNGFKYLVFNIRTQDILNKLSIKLGQIVTYRDMWGNVLSVNIMSKKITYLGGDLEDDDNYEITLSAEEIKETSTEYSYASSIENKLRKTEIAVDKQNQRIEAVASDVNENTEKVASLEITTGNISTKVSSVETDLSTTNFNISNLSNTVDTLDTKINGVSADFEDFKDNEYIQSIDNLQKQIDGAIQFWNGAEIPTLENYPANEWTTENDKINHQADIYTVVQDVEGEMKQGKSYRFDKIDGVWQWIELTDNELSAVQALAQEALNKANANATEIGTIKTNVSELQQTDEQIKASVESIDKQIIPTATATGSNIYVEDASDNPLIQLEIEGKSTQETRSGRNLYNYKDTILVTDGVIVDEDGWITIACDNTEGSGTKYFNYYTNDLNLETSTNYNIITEIKEVSGTGSVLPISQYNGQGQFTSSKIYNFSSLSSNSVLSATMTTEDSFDTSKWGLRSYAQFLAGQSGSITFRLSVLEDTTVTANTFEYEVYGASPSPDYPSEIKSVGYENLFDGSSAGSSGEYLTATGEIATGGTNLRYTDYIKVSNNAKYLTISGIDGSNSMNAPAICFYDSSKTFISGETYSSATIKTFEIPNNACYFRTSYRSIYMNFQIEEGNIIHPYISYGKYGIEVKITNGSDTNTSLIVLNKPPRSLPNGVRDKAYIKNNKLYVDRYVGSRIFDGSETDWIESTVNGIVYFYINLPNSIDATSVSTQLLSNYFKPTHNNNSQNDFYHYRHNIIVFNHGIATILQEFKTWLSIHNTEVIYELAEPYTEVIGEIEMPSTFKGVNHITTTDELEPTINIEYVRDTVLSKYVEGQIDNLKTIEERHYADLSIQNDNIKASVAETQTSLDGTISNMDKLESTMTSQSATLEVISKNIDTTTGEVREVTTTTGFTFNAEGSSIKDSEGYEIKQTPKGAYYKDGDKITGQYTKDGSKQKDLELFGTYSYGKDNIDDTPMFVAQLYTDENGEECFGHFYNGGDY